MADAPKNGERREREEKAEDLAFERGVESARIDTHLAEHDRHLAAINGSIDRVGDKLGALEQCVQEGNVDNAAQFATLRTKLTFYAAIGSLLGGGGVTILVAVATKAGGG